MPAQGKFPARSYREFLLEKMRPGDIVTHCLADRYPYLTEDGKLNPDVTKARVRGVKFDLGHAAGSFTLSVTLRRFADIELEINRTVSEVDG